MVKRPNIGLRTRESELATDLGLRFASPMHRERVPVNVELVKMRTIFELSAGSSSSEQFIISSNLSTIDVGITAVDCDESVFSIITKYNSRITRTKYLILLQAIE